MIRLIQEPPQLPQLPVQPEAGSLSDKTGAELMRDSIWGSKTAPVAPQLYSSFCFFIIYSSLVILLL